MNFENIISECKKCNGIGVIIKKDGSLLDCDCSKRVDYLKRSVNAGIPKIYWKLKKDDYDFFDTIGGKKVVNTSKQRAFKEIMEYIQDFKKNISSGKNIYIWCSQPGRKAGTTLLLTYILRYALKKNMTVLFSPFSFLRGAANDKSYNDATWTEHRKQLIDTDILCLDGVSVFKTEGFAAKERIIEVTDARSYLQKPTLYASYAHPNKYIEMFGPIASSSLSEHNTKFIEIIVKDDNYAEKRVSMNVLVGLLKKLRSQGNIDVSMSDLENIFRS